MSALSLSFSLTQNHRWVCVFDPSLALTLYGAALAQGLGSVMELWMARELWHILDNVQCYQQRPELLLSSDRSAEPPHQQTTRQQQTIQALQQWHWLRMTTDPAKLNFFWIGDKLGESFLPRHATPHLLIRNWEGLACALEEQIDRDRVAHRLAPAFRDTVALAVALPSAFILTYNIQQNQPPEICSTIESWQIPCRQIDRYDHLATLEREQLLHLITRAGVAKLLWSGLHLAILHLVCPWSTTFWLEAQTTEEIQAQDGIQAEIPGHVECEQSLGFPFFHLQDKINRSPMNIWEGTQGFWYWL
ncbi:MAG: hypothetical protein MUF72_13580 [Elainella sp. Prado103]|jgi:hypothetical protein|nr:hypothetical protein [Elainella sp. Prado103]